MTNNLKDCVFINRNKDQKFLTGAWHTDKYKIPYDMLSFDGDYSVRTDNIVVVDFDCKNEELTCGVDYYKRWKEVFGETFTVLTGSGGLHLYYKNPTPLEGNGTNLRSAGLDIDIKHGKGSQVVAPGSVINGKTYRIVKDIPLLDINEHLQKSAKFKEWWDKYYLNPQPKQPEKPLTLVSDTEPETWETKLDDMTEGNRNDTLTKVIWEIVHKVDAEADLKKLESHPAVIQYNGEHPGQSTGRMYDKAMQKKRAEDAQLKANLPSELHGFAWNMDESNHLMDLDTGKSHHISGFTTDNKQIVKYRDRGIIPRVWGQVYVPGSPNKLVLSHQGKLCRNTATYINMSEGLPDKEKEQWYIDKYLEYIDTMVENRAQKQNLHQWIYTLLMHQTIKIGKMLVIIAPQGVGKSTLLEHIAEMVGTDNVSDPIMEDFLDPNNASIVMNRFVYVDEAGKPSYKQRNKLETAIKRYVTHQRILCQDKWVKKYTAESFACYAVASNDLASVPIRTGTRRYFHIDYNQDKEKMNAFNAKENWLHGVWLNDEIKADYIKAIRAYYSRLNIPPMRADTIIAETETLQDAVEDSMTSWQSFIVENPELIVENLGNKEYSATEFWGKIREIFENAKAPEETILRIPKKFGRSGLDDFNLPLHGIKRNLVKIQPNALQRKYLYRLNYSETKTQDTQNPISVTSSNKEGNLGGNTEEYIKGEKRVSCVPPLKVGTLIKLGEDGEEVFHNPDEGDLEF